eukprot:2047057-Amphidinium_carterae.1
MGMRAQGRKLLIVTTMARMKDTRSKQAQSWVMEFEGVLEGVDELDLVEKSVRDVDVDANNFALITVDNANQEANAINGLEDKVDVDVDVYLE